MIPSAASTFDVFQVNTIELSLVFLQEEVALFVVVGFRTDDALGRNVTVDCAVAKFTTVATRADSRLLWLVMVPLDDGVVQGFDFLERAQGCC